MLQDHKMIRRAILRAYIECHKILGSTIAACLRSFRGIKYTSPDLVRILNFI